MTFQSSHLPHRFCTKSIQVSQEFWWKIEYASSHQGDLSLTWCTQSARASWNFGRQRNPQGKPTKDGWDFESPNMSKIYNDNQLNRVMDPSKRVYNSKYIFVMNKKPTNQKGLYKGPDKCNDPHIKRWWIVNTLLEINISYPKALLKMVFLFARWDMLVPWRVVQPNSNESSPRSKDFYQGVNDLLRWLVKNYRFILNCCNIL